MIPPEHPRDFCPRCGVAYEPLQEYCLECGARLPTNRGVVGVLLLFMVPWVGIPVGIVGLVLVVLWLVGFGRAARGGQPGQPPL